MFALLQRVSRAAVIVDDTSIAEIGNGALVFIGFEASDDESVCERALQRIVAYRIFEDAQQRMNLSLRDCGGDLLLVPQFTLAADTRKGNRPSFSSAAPPERATALFDHLRDLARDSELSAGLRVEFGQFGADMRVQLVNRGPVTFLLHIREAN